LITVDTREHHIPKIKDMLATTIIGDDVPQFNFHVLPLADYLIENNDHSILIERKSIADFVGSYRELKSRLAKMRKLDYERTGLLLEGTYTVAQGSVWLYEGRDLKPRMSYKTMSNFLTHQQELGTRLYHTMNLEETIWRLVHLHNYLPKLDTPVATIKAGSPIEWISELPGIGQKTLQELQSMYSSPLEAIQNLPKKSRQLLEKW
jgi:ERCC4-type nuclease